MTISKDHFKLMMLRLQARALKKFNEGTLASGTAEFIMLNDKQYKNQFFNEFEACVKDYPVDHLQQKDIETFIQSFCQKYFHQELTDIEPLAEIMLNGLKTITDDEADSIGDELINAWTEAWDRHHRTYPTDKPDINAQREYVMLIDAKKDEQARRQS